MLKKIHPYTSIALLFNLAALVFLLAAFQDPACLLSLLGFFFTLREVSKYTSRFQFILIFTSALLLGASLDLINSNPLLLVMSMFFAASGSILRIAFFRLFSYTAFSWFEPLCFFLSLGTYLSANLLFAQTCQEWVFPAPVIIFLAVFAWGTVKDKNQLLKKSRGGYRVQLGQEAINFNLPDQDGNPVSLADFKNQRHVLLIFVRGDWCPGCHMMLRTYEKNNEKFRARNIFAMAIGPDPVGVNRGMVEKLGLDFKVLSDEGQKTAMLYGVQLSHYENNFSENYEEGIPLPASFLVDKQGVVRYVSRPDKVGEFLNPSLIFPIIESLH